MLLETLDGKLGRPPIWLMRQAGRYLPEYKKIREKCGSFLNLCYSPEDAAEVTLQPIRRFEFDAAIIFSDILVIPHSLGLELDFLQGEGPKLERITNSSELGKLKLSTSNFQFEKTWETVARVREKLPAKTALIGFAGAPWTVATYILEGQGKTGFEFCKNSIKNDVNFVKNLLEIITEQTIYYLIGQIKAGAEVIQIFDSWAGILNEFENREEFIVQPVKKIVEKLKKEYPKIPVICFPKGINYLEDYLKKISPQAISIGPDVSMIEAKELQKFAVVQGNLDPKILLSSKEKIKKETENILSNLMGKNFIFNLGHGILPETPIENVEFLVHLVRNYGK